MIFRPMQIRKLQFCLNKFANHASLPNQVHLAWPNLTQPTPHWNYELVRLANLIRRTCIGRKIIDPFFSSCETFWILNPPPFYSFLGSWVVGKSYYLKEVKEGRSSFETFWILNLPFYSFLGPYILIHYTTLNLKISASRQNIKNLVSNFGTIHVRNMHAKF